jgi:hypothetical protein
VIAGLNTMLGVVQHSVQAMTPGEKKAVRLELDRRRGGQMDDFKRSVCGLDGLQDGQEMLIDRFGVVFCLKCHTRGTIRTRCLRRDGTERAWFGTAADAVAFANDPANTAYAGDVAVRCTKPSCRGWHLSQPFWPDAVAAVESASISNRVNVKPISTSR